MKNEHVENLDVLNSFVYLLMEQLVIHYLIEVFTLCTILSCIFCKQSCNVIRWYLAYKYYLASL